MMFTPCWPSAGPTGGAGVAWPAGSCRGKVLTSFFFFGGMTLPGSWAVIGSGTCVIDARHTRTFQVTARPVWAGNRLLDLGDLVEVELYRGLPAEDRDERLELLLIGVDLADGRRQ